MTRQQILEQVYKSKSFNTLVNKMEPCDLREDLKHEAIFVLANMSESKLLDIYERGKINDYVTQVVFKSVMSKNSPFYYLHRKPMRKTTQVFTPRGYAWEDNRPLTYDREDILETMLADEEPAEPDHRIEQLPEIVNQLEFFERGMLEVWASLGGNKVKVAKATGIPYKTVEKALARGVKHVVKNIKPYVD